MQAKITDICMQQVKLRKNMRGYRQVLRETTGCFGHHEKTMIRKNGIPIYTSCHHDNIETPDINSFPGRGISLSLKNQQHFIKHSNLNKTFEDSIETRGTKTPDNDNGKVKMKRATLQNGKRAATWIPMKKQNQPNIRWDSCANDDNNSFNSVFNETEVTSREKDLVSPQKESQIRTKHFTHPKITQSEHINRKSKRAKKPIEKNIHNQAENNEDELEQKWEPDEPSHQNQTDQSLKDWTFQKAVSSIPPFADSKWPTLENKRDASQNGNIELKIQERKQLFKPKRSNNVSFGDLVKYQTSSKSKKLFALIDRLAEQNHAKVAIKPRASAMKIRDPREEAMKRRASVTTSASVYYTMQFGYKSSTDEVNENTENRLQELHQGLSRNPAFGSITQKFSSFSCPCNP